MKKYIVATKNRIKGMVKEIKESFNLKNINLGCVVYRDFNGVD
jgi:hypothetical protein